MPLFDTLAEYGLTVKVIQVLIGLGIVVYVLGMYWKQIVAGVAIVFCFFVFAQGVSTSTDKTEEIKTETMHPADIAPSGYIEDCMQYNKMTKEQCKEEWKERE
jgi:hypothetical protein